MPGRKCFWIPAPVFTGVTFLRRNDGEAWYSGVLGEYLVHLRQTGEGLEYRVGGGDGERDDVNLNQSQGGNYILQRWQRRGSFHHQCVGSGL